MTTTTTPETRIEADPKVPLVRITREFDAPPAKVYRAHVDPELYAKWAGPNGVETTVDRWDAPQRRLVSVHRPEPWCRAGLQRHVP